MCHHSVLPVKVVGESSVRLRQFLCLCSPFKLLWGLLLYKRSAAWRTWPTNSEWSDYPQQKSAIGVTETGDLFVLACCHFKCTHRPVTGSEEHDSPAHAPAHCGFQDTGSCNLLLFSSNDHTPSELMSKQTLKKKKSTNGYSLNIYILQQGELSV